MPHQMVIIIYTYNIFGSDFQCTAYHHCPPIENCARPLISKYLYVIMNTVTAKNTLVKALIASFKLLAKPIKAASLKKNCYSHSIVALYRFFVCSDNNYNYYRYIQRT